MKRFVLLLFASALNGCFLFGSHFPLPPFQQGQTAIVTTDTVGCTSSNAYFHYWDAVSMVSDSAGAYGQSVLDVLFAGDYCENYYRETVLSSVVHLSVFRASSIPPIIQHASLIHTCW